MPYCYNCGSEIEAKDRKCGKCSYPVQAVVAMDADGIYTVRGHRKDNAVIEGAKEVWKAIYGMIKSPIDAIQQAPTAIKNHISFVIFVVLAVVNGLLFVWGGRILEAAIKTITGKSAKPGINQGGADLGFYTSIFKFTYGKIFLSGVILFVCAVLVQFLVLHLISRFLFKTKIKAFSIWKISLCSFIPWLGGFAIAFILNYFSLLLSLIALISGAVIAAIALYKGLEEELKLSSNKGIVMILVAYIAMFIGINMFIKYEINSISSRLLTREVIRSILMVLTSY